MRQLFLAVLFFIAAFTVNAQAVAPLWKDFEKAKQSGATPVLPDFSYAGYHFSEREIPDMSGKRHFNVTDFGAKPGDSYYDDAGIQAAIDAAEKDPQGGVVFFPSGKYLIS